MRDYEALTQIITQWNANRLDLFALSLPNEVRPILQTLLSQSQNHIISGSQITKDLLKLNGLGFAIMVYVLRNFKVLISFTE
jgi:hypothetical protein